MRLTFSTTHRFTDRHGLIAILTLIVIGALVLAAGLSAAFIGQSHLAVTGETEQARVARELAAGCVSEALFRLKKDAAYAPTNAVVPSARGNCTIVSVTGSGSTRTIVTSAVSDASLGPQLTQKITAGALFRQNNSHQAGSWEISSWVEGNN